MYIINEPAVSTPKRPARPIICRYCKTSIGNPWQCGDLTITLLAGKFTPEDKVDVATSTLTELCLNAPSIMSLSSIVRPK